jgi:pimeloyl-ACP methyl ester carboxylesterase
LVAGSIPAGGTSHTRLQYTRGMRLFRRVMTIALLAGLLSFAIVPFLLPFHTSGTMTNVEAAGPGAKFTKLGGISVHVDEVAYSGDCACQAPLIVLLHGFGASTFSWREVEAPLSKLGQVIAYDRPAFGFTERPTSWSRVNPYSFAGNFKILDDLIARYGQGRKVVLVGHSAGGQLAAEFARLNPAKVSSLILVDPAILTTGGAPEGLQWVYDIPQIAKLGPILVSSIATSGDQLIYQSFVNKAKVTKVVLAGYHRPLKVVGWEQAFWNFATASKQNQLADNLESLKQPTLLITGDADTVVPTADTLKLHKLIPGSSLEVIATAGHLPHEEQPDAFMAAIERNWVQLSK